MSDVLNPEAPTSPEHVAIHRKDYRPPDWMVPEIELQFELDPTATRVRSTLKVERNGSHDRPLRLSGDGLKALVVKVDGNEVRLTAKEFLLLQYLMQHRGRVLSRDLLLSDVWSYSYTGGTRTVDVHIRRLREKVPLLADAIVTVKQFGYKLLDPAPG